MTTKDWNQHRIGKFVSGDCEMTFTVFDVPAERDPDLDLEPLDFIAHNELRIDDWCAGSPNEPFLLFGEIQGAAIWVEHEEHSGWHCRLVHYGGDGQGFDTGLRMSLDASRVIIAAMREAKRVFEET